MSDVWPITHARWRIGLRAVTDDPAPAEWVIPLPHIDGDPCAYGYCRDDSYGHHRNVTIGNITYRIACPACRCFDGTPERPVVDLIEELFGIEVGNHGELRELLDEAFERKSLVHLPQGATRGDIMDRTVICDGAFGRSYYDLDLARYLASRLPLEACVLCGSLDHRGKYDNSYQPGRDWGPFTHGWFYARRGSKRIPLCGEECWDNYQKGERETWDDLRRSQQLLRRARRLIRKPSEVERLRRLRARESPTAATRPSSGPPSSRT